MSVRVTVRVEDTDGLDGRGVFEATVSTGPTVLFDPEFLLIAARKAAVKVSEEMHVGPEAEASRERHHERGSWWGDGTPTWVWADEEEGDDREV